MWPRPRSCRSRTTRAGACPTSTSHSNRASRRARRSSAPSPSGWRRSSARSPARATYTSFPTCPRRAPERSCAAFSRPSRTRSQSETPARSPTPRSSSRYRRWFMSTCKIDVMSERYEAAYARSIEDPEGFWGDAAADVHWDKKWDRVLDTSRENFARWFVGGLTNTCYNALDVHVDRGRGEQAALIYDSPLAGVVRTYTYRELRDETARFAGALAALRVGKGDRVIIYMPMVPEAVIAMLACARIGAIHSVVFGGFAAPELAKRIADAKPKVI